MKTYKILYKNIELDTYATETIQDVQDFMEHLADIRNLPLKDISYLEQYEK